MHTALHGTLLVLLLGACHALSAQESADGDADSRAEEIEALEPGVSSADLAAERDEQLPQADVGEPVAGDQAVDAVLAQDYRRRRAGDSVMDEIDLGRTEITGNQELPKVLYIVPWRKSDPGDLTGKPINTLLDEVLAPIDRTEFIREVDYYDDLHRQDDR